MSAQIWAWADLVRASGGRADGDAPSGVDGVSIDTRTMASGDLFVALKDARDGHDFVGAAFQAGAAAALVAESYVRRAGDGALLRVPDTLRALERIGVAARDRLERDALVIAVTGSAGKTTTKEMLRVALDAVGRTHASEKSYNNHWGVPLTLARMPADVRFGVFEMGMNHAGEITPLSRMGRPHVGVVTTVGDAHLEHFADGVAGIARAKAEIFSGADNGWAILPYDNPHYGILCEAAAMRRTLRIIPFTSTGPAVDPSRPSSARLLSALASESGTSITAQLPSGITRTFDIALHGAHNVSNALAVAALFDVLTGVYLSPDEADRAFAALVSLPTPQGRGQRIRLSIGGSPVLLIDESYNANPASMRAALATLASISRAEFPRRVAVLGDMLELGADAAGLHRSLDSALIDAGVDQVFACGPHMKGLYDALPAGMRGRYAETASALGDCLPDALAAGDVVMLKASNGTRLGPVVERLKAKLAAKN